ncbi:Pimeloyl-ACP methyl ester carboxylesterase [Actinokineospora alba]|uniref:Pimeloyl-ACP methyl ester carboxylesterase n=1 Tax=Actinokineospora alba TaxID=504798 RepID=A0A1H0QZ29_9PSEU|nr:alpha/beta hydrolase [Actinokineospora alba]TDP70323.1 pimeloyl-ACP methyl ester carboxylesterase [Actinokineospora alba]SDI34113.1 Pimeloyl-ACP methyl ester carboxylesterase [Actinokineospora alba]SDP22573.1 Pimeloyl-ACP methyl ester carboxylesterase [Actinokineospora alba]
MSDFIAFDGTRLTYHALGEGNPVIVLPGGPMQDSAYLGDLGGLSSRVRLIRLDLRGTGESPTTDLASCRCDRLVEDVEALREQLGLDRVDLLAHSAGTNLAALYAARYAERVGALVLVTPSTYAVGITISPDVRRAVIERRKGEPWYGQVSAAFDSIAAGEGTVEDWEALVPFTYGRWDDTARAHHAAGEFQRNPDAAEAYAAEGAFSPDSTRAALGALGATVLVLAGDHDLSAPEAAAAELADLFPNAKLVTLARGGHFPWLDDPDWFTETVASFLA